MRKKKEKSLHGQTLCQLRPLSPQPGASSHFCYAYTYPALPRSLVECLAYKKPDTLARHARRRYRGTSARGRRGRHSYACANLNFQMGVYRLSQPLALLLEIWTFAAQ